MKDKIKYTGFFHPDEVDYLEDAKKEILINDELRQQIGDIIITALKNGSMKYD